MSNQTSDPLDLLNSAAQEGLLSEGSLNVAMSIPDLGVTMQQALGTPAGDVQATEQFLLTYVIDDSGSIRMANNEHILIAGVNFNIEAQLKGRYVDGIMASIRYLNGKLLCPYLPLRQVSLLDASNYQAVGGTPLYDVTVATLLAVIAKTQELQNAGITARTQTLIVTDGDDRHSVHNNASDVAKIVADMLGTEQHIIAAMGIDDGSTDFVAVFTSMGIQPQWIITPGSTEKEMRAAFMNYSRTTTAAAGGMLGFSKAAIGGFGTTP